MLAGLADGQIAKFDTNSLYCKVSLPHLHDVGFLTCEHIFRQTYQISIFVWAIILSAPCSVQRKGSGLAMELK